MKRQSLAASILLAGLVGATSLAAREMPRMAIRNLRSLGMGGAAVAVPGEDNILFYNPALLRTLKHMRINVVDLSVHLNTSALDQYGFYQDHETELENVDDLNADELNDLYSEALTEAQKLAILSLQGPLPVHVLSPNFGAGFFSQAGMTYEIFEGATGLPIVDVRFMGDAQAMASLARTFSAGPQGAAGDLSVGVTTKYLRRWVTAKTKTISGFSGSEEFHVYRGNSIGLDLGALYILNRNWLFGAALYDAFSTDFGWNTKNASFDNPAPANKIDPAFRFGTNFRPGWRLQKWFYNVSFALDVDQPFDGNITFFKKIYMGGEANLTPFLRMRGGFGQGYPSFGLGLNFLVLRADYAFYGEEIGKYAGQLASWNHAVRVQLGF